jgi:YHS domain-containing protein/thiol-disulfide isomerase/thioredoxin
MLLHFGATWCGPCQQVERNVFTNPDAVAAINAQFVPVKIDVDQHPELKDQFTVGPIPADLVVAPGGRVLQRDSGAKSAADYVASLQRAATYYGQSVAYGKNVAAASPPVPTMPVIGVGHTTGFGPTTAQNPATQHASTQNPAVFSGVGYQAPAQNFAPPQQQLVPQQPFVQQPFAQPPVTQQPIGQQSTVQQSAPYQQMAGPVAAAATPSGNPPLSLDGFCPVRLAERGEWTPGLKEYGLRHRGRTYLFAGPDEWQRFNADPDKYAPLASGFDPVLIVDARQQVDGDRKHGVTYRGQVLLFSSEETLGRFSRDPQRYAALLRPADR